MICFSSLSRNTSCSPHPRNYLVSSNLKRITWKHRILVRICFSRAYLRAALSDPSLRLCSSHLSRLRCPLRLTQLLSHDPACVSGPVLRSSWRGHAGDTSPHTAGLPHVHPCVRLASGSDLMASLPRATTDCFWVTCTSGSLPVLVCLPSKFPATPLRAQHPVGGFSGCGLPLGVRSIFGENTSTRK